MRLDVRVWAEVLADICFLWIQVAVTTKRILLSPELCQDNWTWMENEVGGQTYDQMG
jgi:hypothetical protein